MLLLKKDLQGILLICIAYAALLGIIPGLACGLFAQENPPAQDGPARKQTTIGISVEKFTPQDAADIIGKCKHCGSFVKLGGIHRDAENVLENLVKEGLDYRNIPHEGGKEKDKYLHVYVFRYEERRGGNFSVEKPAGVGFHMHLFDQGALKRVFIFDEDQRPLSENIFGFWKFLRRGGKWVTADVLSEEGIEKGLDLFSEDLK